MLYHFADKKSKKRRRKDRGRNQQQTGGTAAPENSRRGFYRAGCPVFLYLFHRLKRRIQTNGGGSIFTFEIRGDAKTAQTFIDHLAIFSLLANVADVKSLVIHPATTTHSQCTEEELLDQGIRPNTIRLSIGIEKAEDLIAALDAAFEAVK